MQQGFSDKVFTKPLWFNVHGLSFRTDLISYVAWNTPGRDSNRFKTTVTLMSGLQVDIFGEERRRFAAECFNFAFELDVENSTKLTPSATNAPSMVKCLFDQHDLVRTIAKELGEGWEKGLVKIDSTWGDNNNPTLSYLCVEAEAVALWCKATGGYFVLSSKIPEYYIGQIIAD
jgi:hypothetical protein